MEQNDYEGIDEDDVAEREFLHSWLTFHVLSLLIVEIILIVSKFFTVIFFPNENLLFPASFLFANEFGKLISKHYLSRYFQVVQADAEFLKIVLGMIFTTIAVCLLCLSPEDSREFISRLLSTVINMIVLTFVLGLSLLLILM